MKALSLQGPGKLELVDMARPEPASDQLLIATQAATICTSDLHDIQANPFGIELPIVIGHEGAGIVAAVGANTQGFKIGDRIAAHPVHPCRVCDTCRSGLAHLCPHMGHFGLNMQGTFADYFVVRADRARIIPDTVDWAVAALAEPICVCLEALEQARLAPDQTLLIIGDGPFGILMARLARMRGLHKIVVAGYDDARLARASGSVTVNTRGIDAQVALQREAPPMGYDAAILAVSAPDVLNTALALLRPRGRLVLFAPLPSETPVDLVRVHLKELEIVGACNDPDLFDMAVGLLNDPVLRLDELITHRYRLAEFRAAFSIAASREDGALKPAIIFA